MPRPCQGRRSASARSGKVSVTGGVDVREELFQFLIRLENAILCHVSDRLDGPDTLAPHLLVDGLGAGFRRLSGIASAIGCYLASFGEMRTGASLTRSCAQPAG